MDRVIIDTHQHVWDLDCVAYPWLKPDDGILCRTYHADELEPQMKAVGVTATVLVQAADSYADTEYMLQQAQRYPWIIGVVGWAPLLLPDVAGRTIERFKKHPLFRGVRHLIHNEPSPTWLLQEPVIESLKLLAAAGLTFDVVPSTPEHRGCIPVLSERIPNLKMVIDHMGHPPVGCGSLGHWAEDMEIAADNPNVYLKISGLGTAGADPDNWTVPDIKPYVEYGLKTFGVERCMVGGDWPVSNLGGGYVKTWTAYLDVLSALLPKDQQDRVLRGTAEAFYGIRAPRPEGDSVHHA